MSGRLGTNAAVIPAAVLLVACGLSACTGPLKAPTSTVAEGCPSDLASTVSIDGMELPVERAVALARAPGEVSIRLATFVAPEEVLSDPALGTTAAVDLAAGEMILIFDVWSSEGSPIASATFLTDPDAESQVSAGLLAPSGARSLGTGAVALTAVSPELVCGVAAFEGLRARFAAPVVQP